MASQPPPDAGSSTSDAGGSTPDRPTAAEREEALEVICLMKEAMPPLLAPRKGRPPESKAVACAIALFRGEHFNGGQRAAKRRFGVPPETELQNRWIDGLLPQFAPAGFNTQGLALPPYLLERDEAAVAKDERLLHEMTLGSRSTERRTRDRCRGVL